MVIVSPEDIQPYPKAKQRKNTNKGRKPGKTMIATDTPEKLQIKLIKDKKNSVKRKLNINQNLTTVAKKNKSKDGKSFKKGTKKTDIKKERLPSSSEEDDPIPLVETDDEYSND